MKRAFFAATLLILWASPVLAQVSAPTTITVRNEGVFTGRARVLDFTGGAVLVTHANGVSTVSINALTSPISAQDGGTGWTVYTIGDLLYASGTTTLSKLAAPASGQIIQSNGVGVAPSWSSSFSLSHALTSDSFSRVRNSSNNSIATQSLSVGNDTSIDLLKFTVYSSAHSFANQSRAVAGGSGGLQLTASHASGTVKISAANTLAATFTGADTAFAGVVTGGTYNGQTVSSAASLTGTLNVLTGPLLVGTATAGAAAGGDIRALDAVYERARTVPMGESQLVAYSAGNFTASAGTWGVDSGDHFTYEWEITGKTMTLWFYFGNTDVSNASVALRFPVPGGYTSLRSILTPVIIKNAGGTEAIGMAQLAAGSTVITLYTSVAGAVFSLTTGDNTDVYGTLRFPIQ